MITYDPALVTAVLRSQDGSHVLLSPLPDHMFDVETHATGGFSITFQCESEQPFEPLSWSHRKWMELMHGHRGRRVVGRKIRQARRRMRRLMEGCL